MTCTTKMMAVAVLCLGTSVALHLGEDNAPKLPEKTKGKGPDTSLTIAGGNQADSWVAHLHDCKEKDSTCHDEFPNECSWEDESGVFCCKDNGDDGKCPSSYERSEDPTKKPKLAPPSKVPQEEPTTPPPQRSSADDDLAVIMAQPCSDDPVAVADAEEEAGLSSPNASDLCDGEYTPPGIKKNKTSDIFVRLVPISEMTPEEKKAVARREAKVVKEMETVANKTMKAMMAKQIADKVKCVADKKDAELKRLRAGLTVSSAQAKVSSKLAEADSFEGQLEFARANQVQECTKESQTCEKLECLKKAAAKAEVTLKEKAKAQIMAVKQLEQKATAVQLEAESAQDNLSATMKAERKEMAILSKEACKTRAVARKAQVQAVAAQREVQAARSASTEIVDGPPCPDAPADCESATGDAIAAITGQRPEELAATTAQPAVAAAAPPAAAAASPDGANSSAPTAAAAEAPAAPPVAAAAAPPVAAAAAPPAAAAAAPPVAAAASPNGETTPPTSGAGSEAAAAPPCPSATQCPTKYDCEGPTTAMTGSEKDWCCAHKKTDLCPAFQSRAGLSSTPLMPQGELPWEVKGTGCPDRDAAKCLNANAGYDTVEEAWVACGTIVECGIVLQHKGKAGLKFYLRRSDDPVTTDVEGKSLKYAGSSGGSASGSR